MRSIILTTLLLWSMSVQGADTDKCLLESNVQKRLKCYDSELGYDPVKHSNKLAKTQPKPVSPITFYLREDARINSLAAMDLAIKPGRLSAQHSAGETGVIAKVGAIVSLAAINELGWQPFVSFSFDRDDLAKSPKDVRDFGLGITGPLWDVYDPKWTLYATPRIFKRISKHAGLESTLANIDVSLIYLPWVNQPEDPLISAFSFVPNFGFLTENRSGDKVDSGRWNSAYLGANLIMRMNELTPRLQANLGYQFFKDFTTPGNNANRSLKFSTLSLSYELTDPNDKSISIRPSLVVSREIGNDPVKGVGEVNRTIFGLGLKIN